MKILYMYEYIVCKYSISNYNVYYSLIFIGVKINSFLQRFINFDQILFGANIQNTNYYAIMYFLEENNNLKQFSIFITDTDLVLYIQAIKSN